MANKKKKKNVFKDFSEYWHYVSSLSFNQKEIIFKSLSRTDQDVLIKSCIDDGWEDLLNRNLIYNISEEMKSNYNFDLLDIRRKVLNGKSVYLPTVFWKNVTKRVNGASISSYNLICGGIVAEECHNNPDVVLLLPASSNVLEKNKKNR